MELRPAVRVTLIVFFLASAAISIYAANNEINKCQTVDVSGSYVLAQNIEPNTKLRRGITICGGTIQNFQIGIDLHVVASRAGAIIRNNVCSGNGNGSRRARGRRDRQQQQ